MAEQLDEQPFDLIVLEILFNDSLCALGFHLSSFLLSIA
jgi:hypothetical protein